MAKDRKFRQMFSYITINEYKSEAFMHKNLTNHCSTKDFGEIISYNYLLSGSNFVFMSLLTRTGAHVGGKIQRRQSDRAKRVLSPCSSKVRLFSSSLGIGLPVSEQVSNTKTARNVFLFFFFFA